MNEAEPPLVLVIMYSLVFGGAAIGVIGVFGHLIYSIGRDYGLWQNPIRLIRSREERRLRSRRLQIEHRINKLSDHAKSCRILAQRYQAQGDEMRAIVLVAEADADTRTIGRLFGDLRFVDEQLEAEKREREYRKLTG